MQKIENAAFERDSLWLETLVQQAQAQGFYGELRLIFEKGLVVRVIKEQSLRPPHYQQPTYGVLEQVDKAISRGGKPFGTG
jgi:hypothetical protein